jgi:hypothetical protein
MGRRTSFSYGEGGTSSLAFTISSGLWLPQDKTIGGSRTSAAGVPASYVVRRDALIQLTVRLWESEWGALLNFISWAQGSGAFLWFPDADDVATSFSVYLESPLAGEAFAPTRDSNYPRVFTAQLTLRGAGITVPWLPFFED